MVSVVQRIDRSVILGGRYFFFGGAGSFVLFKVADDFEIVYD